jgi:hypothetical protein
MKPDASIVSEIIEMALSDHVSFAQIKTLHGLGPGPASNHGDTLGVNGQSVILFFIRRAARANFGRGTLNVHGNH